MTGASRGGSAQSDDPIYEYRLQPQYRRSAPFPHDYLRISTPEPLHYDVHEHALYSPISPCSKALRSPLKEFKHSLKQIGEKTKLAMRKMLDALRPHRTQSGSRTAQVEGRACHDQWHRPHLDIEYVYCGCRSCEESWRIKWRRQSIGGRRKYRRGRAERVAALQLSRSGAW